LCDFSRPTASMRGRKYCVATEAVNEDEGVGACAELFDIEELRSDTG
jgi:hypothetical protein